MAVNPFELATEVRTVDAMEMDQHADGIPPALVEGLATEVVRLLVKNGIDPSNAYFRGRQGEPDEIGAAAARIREVEEWGIDYGAGYDEPHTYDEILLEPVRRNDATEAALGRQIDGDPNPEYTLGKLDTLFSDDTLINPLHEAGVSDESYLDVYSMPMIDSMDPGQEEGINKVVSIPEEQLALAAVARVHLQYNIVNEDV